MEELMERVNFVGVEECWGLGSVLNEDSLVIAEQVLSILANGEKPEVSDCSLVQAECIAEFIAKFDEEPITITEKQKYLYAVLRDIPNGKAEVESNPQQDTVSPSALSDQRLMAEVIRLTDETKLKSFIGKYPNTLKRLE